MNERKPMVASNKARDAFTKLELLVVIAVLGIVVLMIMPPMPHHSKMRAQRIQCMSNLKYIGKAAGEEWEDHELSNISTLNGPPQSKPRLPNMAEVNANIPDGGYTYQYFGLLSNHLATAKMLVCPADERTAHTNFAMLKDNKVAGAFLNNTKVSYFVGLAAERGFPQMIRSGDRNIGSNEFGTDYGYSLPPDVGTGNYAELGTNNTSVGWTTKMHKKQGNVVFVDGHVEGMNSQRLTEALRVSRNPNTTTGGNWILFP